jgi:hypothetical protein
LLAPAGLNAAIQASLDAPLFWTSSTRSTRAHRKRSALGDLTEIAPVYAEKIELRCHKPSQHRRKSNPVAGLKSEHKAALSIVIKRLSSNAVMARRIEKAWRANRTVSGIVVKRPSCSSRMQAHP